MGRFLVATLGALSLVLGSNAALASNIEITVTQTGISGIAEVVASWTQDQNPTPIEFVKDYYTTVPVFNTVGLGPDTAVTWYSDKDNHFGGFSNFNLDFNVLAPASYAFTEGSPTFVPGKYAGVNLRPGFVYIPTTYSIAVIPDAPKAKIGRLNLIQPATPATPAVPEPDTWAMMIVGLGLIGFAARQRRNYGVSPA